MEMQVRLCPRWLFLLSCGQRWGRGQPCLEMGMLLSIIPSESGGYPLQGGKQKPNGGGLECQDADTPYLTGSLRMNGKLGKPAYAIPLA